MILTHTQRILCTGVQSGAFLPENRFLLASTSITGIIRDGSIADGPILAVYILDPVPAPERQGGKPLPVAIFALELGRDVIPFRMQLHYHLNVHSESAVPFFSSPADHIVALETSNHLKPLNARRGFAFPLRHILLIPIAKLLSHVSLTENVRPCYIQWDDWGATGTRRVPASWPSHCCNALSGSRFIPRPESCNFIGVWDFSRARVAQLQTFVPESVPCIQREVALPNNIQGSFIAAISEDVIVIREASIVALSSYFCPTGLPSCHL